MLGPVRNQSDVGWCFGNTAADLLTVSNLTDLRRQYSTQQKLDAEFLDLFQPQLQVSSMFASLHYFHAHVLRAPDKNTIFGYGGFIYDTLMLVQDEGYLCTQKFDVDLMKRGYEAPLQEKLAKFTELYGLYQNWVAAKKIGNDDAATINGDELLALINELKTKNSILVDFESKLEPALQEPTLHRAVMKVISIVCDEKIRVPIRQKKEFYHYQDFNYIGQTKLHTRMRSENRIIDREQMDYSKEIDKAMALHRPVGISYMVENVVAPPHPGRGAHASVISGRKKINGVCHYQIRNSWGLNCEFGHFSENKWSNLPIYRPEYICENGTFWVNKDDINRITMEAIYQK